MEEWSVDVLPGQVLQWAREDATEKHPRLWVRVGREFALEQRDLAGVSEDDDVNLVETLGVLEISPVGGQAGWTLLVRVEGTAELRPAGEGDSYDPDAELSLEDFESQFLVPEHGEVDVTVQVEDAAARRRFEDWLKRRLGS
jgi:hypothetical protein